MYNFSFFKEEEIKKDNSKLFEKYGLITAITDYAILLGGEVSSSYFTIDERRAGFWWTSSINDNNERCAIYADGTKKWEPPYPRMIGARPSISYESIKDKINVVNEKDIFEVEFGEYPQTITKKEISVSLEELYEQNLLNKTGKVYSADNINSLDSYTPFEYRSFEEYEYQNNKYIRFLVGVNPQAFKLSNEEIVEEDKVYWIKVEPIKWIVDIEEDIMISKDILFAGIQMDKDITNWSPNFEDTQMKEFLDKYFSNEIIPSVIVKEKVTNKAKKEYAYNFDFSEVTEEEIIKGCIESNIAVMLHGKSGDGKSARVKQLDPDAEILYLINASPESLCGKSIVLPNGEMKDIPPTWYTRLVSICKKEPDKIHIVFFDEITNASGSIQGLSFNIILDKEVNGKWKLPDNARIVAAGNELEESMSSYGMSEPLFNRFAHVYIETKVEDFLMWASTPSETYERLDYKKENVPMKIHPSIYAFIAYKGETVLRTEYNGIKPNADPRKWELASKILYETNKPETLKALVGEELTKEFILFTKKEVISIDDVINYNYTENDLIMDTGEKFATVANLSKVDVEYIYVVREFVSTLGDEILDLFDVLWVSGKEERVNIINELKIKNKCYNKHV